MSGNRIHLNDQASFEAALDVLLELIVRGQDLVAAERQRPQPDEALAGQWQQRVDGWVAQRDQLEARDHEAVASVLNEQAALLRSLHLSDQ